MSQERWHEIKALFQAALEQPPAGRESFVAGRCDDGSTCAEVMRLLSLHGGSADFLQTPIEPAAKAEPSSGIDPLIGRRLGGFLILRHIGAGGMGAVYEAQQEKPNRLAAVKILRPGFATGSMIRRFEYESEVLAKLQHSGIAHVYASGTFDFGDGVQPWFAMELVNGPSLHEYARNRRSGMRDKLRLLMRICDAVQHAHQRGVIHRDLKPANILVTEGIEGLGDSGKKDSDSKSTRLIPQSTDPSVPRPKILDFGVARAIDADIQATMHTAVGELVGTLSYMSPEQLCGDPDRIDARSDLYSLGVIGYELLAGRLPLGQRGSAVADAIRAIERDEPRPLGAVDPDLRGDVEAIFAKALEKDPARRYGSVAEFSADLGRYLNHEPVLVRPPTMLYQFRKYARRNRALVGGTLATIAALAAGLVLYRMEARQAQTEAARSKYEADKATAVNNFIINDFIMQLLAAANSADSTGPLPVAELVDQASEKIGVMFANQPLAEAAVRNEIASIYYNLSAYDKAAMQFRLALEGWEPHLGPDHPDTLKAVNNLGQALAAMGRGDEAEPLYRRALAGRRRVLGDDDPFTLVTMNNLATLLMQSGRLEDAEEMLRSTLEAQRRVHGENHKNTLTTLANLAWVVGKRNRMSEALPMLRTVVERCRETLGERHIMTLTAEIRLANALIMTGELEAAERMLVDVVQMFEQTLGGDHREAIIAGRALVQIYESEGRLSKAEAAALSAEAVRQARDNKPGSHWQTPEFLLNVAETLTAMGRFSEAEARLLTAYEQLVKTTGSANARTVDAIQSLVALYDAWQTAEPTGGHDVRGAEWRQRLEETSVGK